MSSLQDSPGVTPYPPDAVERYVREGLWGDTRIEDLIGAAAAATPDAPAVIDESGVTTHGQLHAEALAAAATLLDQGVRPEDNVVVQMPNTAAAIVVLLGCFHLGARPVMALHTHRSHEISGFIDASGATHWILGELVGVERDRLIADIRKRLAPKVEPVVIHWDVARGHPSERTFEKRTDAAADELAFFQLSGGTTGASKLIPRAHREYAYSFLRSNELCGVGRETVMVIPIPLTHNFPMSSPGFLGVLAVGGTVVLLPDGDPARVASAIEEFGATHLVAVPPLIQALLDSSASNRHDLTGLRRVLVGGARLSPAVARRIVHELGPLQQVYGMAEGLVCYTDPDGPLEATITTQGRPMSGADEVKVVDPLAPDSPELPHDAVGELQVRGPYTIRGYYRPDARAAAAFTTEGFYRTGDLVRRGQDGSITVVGRVKEQINRGGEKISPAEVENALLTHAGVHDACVLGEDDDILGERTVAHVVAREGVAEEQRPHRRNLRAHLVEMGLAPFKIPDAFRVVDRLPNTAVGKIARDRIADDPDMYDVIGVGFGPANMAVDIALRETSARSRSPLHVAFFEASSAPSWHAGLLFEDASMQVSFAKDLATMRNPRSAFSFMQFLFEHGRLADFINRGSTSPLRVEFVEYLKWVADGLADDVTYSSRVEAIRPVTEEGTIVAYDVDVRGDSGVRRVRGRDVLFAPGLQPVLPDFLEPGPRIWHSSQHLHRVEELDSAEVERIAVIGGGQSAAEVLLDMRHRFPGARVHSIHSRFGLTPSDSSPFANQIFDPESVDLLYNADDGERARIDELHANTNDSVVAPQTLQELFDIDYRDKWLGRDAFVWHRMSRVVGMDHDTAGTKGSDRVHLLLRDALSASEQTLEVDAVVCATGYRPLDPGALLRDSDTLERDAQGRPVTSREYRARWQQPATGQLYLLGQTRHQHGVSATLLSNAATRAQEISDAILAARAEETQASRSEPRGAA